MEKQLREMAADETTEGSATDKGLHVQEVASRAVLPPSPALRGAGRSQLVSPSWGTCSRDDTHLFGNRDCRGGSNRKPQCQHHVAQCGDRHGGTEEFLLCVWVIVGLRNIRSY